MRGRLARAPDRSAEAQQDEAGHGVRSGLGQTLLRLTEGFCALTGLMV